jgi:hypothetical protein
MTNPDVIALGCTPEALGLDQPYSSATAFQILASWEVANSLDSGSGAISSFATGTLLADGNLGVTAPADLRTVSMDFDPEYAGDQTLARFQIQHDFDQHTLTLLTGYAEGKTVSRQDYDGVVGNVLTMYGGSGHPAFGLPGITTDYAAVLGYAPSLLGSTIYDTFPGAVPAPGCGVLGALVPFDCNGLDAAFGVPDGMTSSGEAAAMLELLMNFTSTGDPLGTPGPFTGTYTMGLFPISEPNPNQLDSGIWGGLFLGFSDRAVSYDQSDGYSNNFSQEIRINSDFDGAFNYVLGGFYMRQEDGGSYYVMQTALDHLAAAFSAATNIGPALANDPSMIWQLSPSVFDTPKMTNQFKAAILFLRH